MVDEVVVPLPDGRTLQGFATPARDHGAPVVLWHHGTPHTGVPLRPVTDLVLARGARLVTYARPGYGRSTAHPGRTVGSAADDVAHLADAVGVERCVTVGASGGGPHALACAALGTVGVYAALFATGFFLYGRAGPGLLFSLVAAGALGGIAVLWRRLRFGLRPEDRPTAAASR